LDELESHSTLAQITNVRIERHEYILLSVAKKVIATSVSSTEAFTTAGLALQLKVPTTAASISGPNVEEEWWNSGLDGWLEVVAASIHLEAVVASIQLEAVVAAMSKSTRLRETLPTAS
jgi:hypothetical protein